MVLIDPFANDPRENDPRIVKAKRQLGERQRDAAAAQMEHARRVQAALEDFAAARRAVYGNVHEVRDDER